MKLTLDTDNRIIGVNEDSSTYEYTGYLPDDFNEHTTDGFYMLENNEVTVYPDVSNCNDNFIPSEDTSKLDVILKQIVDIKTEIISLRGEISGGGN